MSYPVFLAPDYLALLRHAENSFANLLFYQNTRGQYTYTDYLERVKRAVTGLKEYQSPTLICGFVDAEAFIIGYMATILSGHIACLCPPGHAIPSDLSTAPVLTDSMMDQWLSLNETPWENMQPLLPDDVCTIAFSSGTSSASKGIMLSQRNLLTDTEFSMKLYHYWSGQRLVHILPFWHVFGLATDLLAPLHAGSSLYFPASHLEFFRAMRAFHPHSINMPPAVADALCVAIASADHVEQITGGELMKVIVSGAPLKNETAQRLASYGIAPCVGYGLTECSPCISLTGEDSVRIGTSGRPLECISLNFAEDGEILVKGPIVMKGYWGQENGPYAQDGYFHTGDLGKLDEAGHLVILGRKGNMLVFDNGTKCIPETIEEFINSVDGVHESLLTTTGSGTSMLPKLIVVTQHQREFDRIAIDCIMKQSGLFPFYLELREAPLQRNALGKVVRKNDI